MEKKPKGKIVVISGPSGVGKGTLVGIILARVPDTFLSVSATTRRPRPGEVDGVSYFFLSKEKFLVDIKRGAFLEWANIYGDHYGTPKAPIDEAVNDGKLVILEIDVQGGRQVRQTLGDKAAYVFIAPPSFDELSRRLRGRKTESRGAREERLTIAADELKLADEYDFVIINDNLDRAANALEEILRNKIREGGI